MLPKSFRLKDASLFQKAFRSGKPFFFESVDCKALFLKDQDARVGFAISKKLFPKAVDRNHVKRMLSGAVRRVFMEIPPGWHIIFFLRKKVVFDQKDAERAVSAIVGKIKNSKI